MRTTLTIDDELYRTAKSVAAQTGRSVGEVIEDALRLMLAAPPQAATSVPPLPRTGRGGLRPGVHLDSWVELADVLDEDIPLDALR